MSYSFKFWSYQDYYEGYCFCIYVVYVSCYGLGAQNTRGAKEMPAPCITIMEWFYHFPKKAF